MEDLDFLMSKEDSDISSDISNENKTNKKELIDLDAEYA